MDAKTSLAGMLSFLTRQPPTGTGGWEAGAKFLRLSGITILVGGALTLLLSVWYWVSLQAHPEFAALYAAWTMMNVVFGLAVLAAGTWWVNFAYNHWCNRDVRGYKHSLIIAVLLVVFGGWGAYGLLTGLGRMSTFSGSGILGTVYTLQLLVSGLFALACLGTGIMVLVNRNKPDCKAAFGQGATTGTYTPHS